MVEAFGEPLALAGGAVLAPVTVGIVLATTGLEPSTLRRAARNTLPAGPVEIDANA